MKKFSSLAFLIFMVAQFSLGKNNQKDIWELLPKADELQDWKPGANPEQYVGDDLYIFINGGAEIYHEYGFKQVVFNEYKDKKNNSINVEIYEMNSSESAFGIYSFKVGNKGEYFSIGNDAFLQSYYMNFWEDNYLVILTGFDENEETITGIKTIAKVIDNKIPDKGKKPHLVNLLPPHDLKIPQIKYVKGILGMFNQYNFGAGNIFRFKEGVLGSYKTYQLFILNYDDEKESLDNFRKAIPLLQNSSRFTNFIFKDKTISMQDENDKHLDIRPFKNYILIFLSEEDFNLKAQYEGVQKYIINHSDQK